MVIIGWYLTIGSEYNSVEAFQWKNHAGTDCKWINAWTWTVAALTYDNHVMRHVTWIYSLRVCPSREKVKDIVILLMSSPKVEKANTKLIVCIDIYSFAYIIPMWCRLLSIPDYSQAAEAQSGRPQDLAHPRLLYNVDLNSHTQKKKNSTSHSI